jgi:hypothetical protein
MDQPVNMAELVELARRLMPPQYAVLVRPEEAERVRAAVSESPYRLLLEVIEAKEVPEGKCVLMRKDLVKCQPRTMNIGPLSWRLSRAENPSSP